MSLITPTYRLKLFNQEHAVFVMVMVCFGFILKYDVSGHIQRRDTNIHTYQSDHTELHQHISASDQSGLINSNHIDHQDSNSGNSDLSEVESVAAAQAAAAAAASLRGPYFDVEASKNVIALVGKTASMTCRVKNLGNRTVSWIRHRDIHLLTVGRSTYTSDQRFSCLHNPQTEEWILQVRYPQRRDSGIYECQVSTTPPIGHSMNLSVVEPITTILGGPDMYINRGSTMNLTCIVKHSPEPPPAIFWTHNENGINYDSPRGGVSVITEKGDITVSYLLVQRARPPDSGKYTCNPSNANSKTVVVHVLNGEHPAAMQHGGQLRLEYPISACLLSVLITILGT